MRRENNACHSGTFYSCRFCVYRRNLSLKNGKKKRWTTYTCAKRSAFYSSESAFSQTNGNIIELFVSWQIQKYSCSRSCEARCAACGPLILQNDFCKWTRRSLRITETTSWLLISGINNIALINSRPRTDTNSSRSRSFADNQRNKGLR